MQLQELIQRSGLDQRTIEDICKKMEEAIEAKNSILRNLKYYAPVSATNTAAADNPNQPQVKKRGGRVAGAGPSMTPDAIRKRVDKKRPLTSPQGESPTAR